MLKISTSELPGNYTGFYIKGIPAASSCNVLFMSLNLSLLDRNMLFFSPGSSYKSSDEYVEFHDGRQSHTARLTV